MTDWFAFLDLPCRPRLAESEIKERYLTLAAKLHPDASAGDTQAFGDLQQAFRGLSDPALRIRHLLALRFPGHPVSTGAMPPADLFMQVGPVLQQARAASQKLERATSTLARTLASLEVGEVLARLKSVRRAVEQTSQSLEERLADLDQQWPEVAPGELAAWAGEWTFLAKWRAELAEWEFRLANAAPVPNVSAT